MKKQWIAVGFAIMIASLSAFGQTAQGPGPQGAGSEEAAKVDAPRSYNPIKWMKKDPNKTTEKPKKEKNKKPSAPSSTQDPPAPQARP